MRALITGVNGQDGSYLAELLVDKGYEVYGMIRRHSTQDMKNLTKVLASEKFHLIVGDMTDYVSLQRVMEKAQPDEIYNLAAQSFVQESWNEPLFTSDVNGMGVVRLLEIMRIQFPHAKFYQASTSEMFGNNGEAVQTLDTKFLPASPYAISKLYAHMMAINYRKSYGLFVCCGILFNHESPRRGHEFVTQKIIDGVKWIKGGLKDSIELGNLSAKRDWGYAKEYVEAMWLMLQENEARDYIISTGKVNSVEDFVRIAFEEAGLKDYEKHIKISTHFMRPTDVYVLRGDPSKASEQLGWIPKTDLRQLIKIMLAGEND